jgi:CheY-like chemotaxis protein
MPFKRLDGRTIIIAEDHDDARAAISNLLFYLGASVVTAKDGLEGLEAFKHHRAHLVITDLRMPRMNGFEFLREIRALPAADGGQTPVIAFTAFDVRVERQSMIEMGFQACLQKPLTGEELVGVMTTLLEAQ